MSNHGSDSTEVVDQVAKAREQCEEHATKFKKILDECNVRVNSRKKTAETCHEEMVDYVQALDHCVSLVYDGSPSTRRVGWVPAS